MRKKCGALLSEQPTYYSSDQIRKKEMGRVRSMYLEKIGAFRIFVGKSEERAYFYY
jgi:hypothetical protein